MQTYGSILLNSFSSIHIDGLININDAQVPLTCSRGTSRPVKTTIIKSEFRARVGGPPTRPPSKLPPPGDLCLHISVQPERLGHGRVGSVYPISVDDPSNLSLPPLVIKVSARHRSEKLAREAWFYEEMEHLQGSSIARCYGFFSAEIDSKSDVLGWAESDEKYDPDEIDESEDEGDIEDGDNEKPPPPTWSNRVWNVADLPKDSNGWPIFPPTSSRSIKYTPEAKYTTEEGSSIDSDHSDPNPASDISGTTLISVLVLERLGGLIPQLVSLESIKPDIHEIYGDIGRFGIEQIDIRWRNILAAPTTHNSLVCPYHGHKHQWRVVDFDRARKSNFSQYEIDSCQQLWLARIFRSLPEGYVIEPWE